MLLTKSAASFHFRSARILSSPVTVILMLIVAIICEYSEAFVFPVLYARARLISKIKWSNVKIKSYTNHNIPKVPWTLIIEIKFRTKIAATYPIVVQRYRIRTLVEIIH